MELSLTIILILIVSGVVVAFINTFAGGGSVISISLFMILGMSPLHANVINRVPVLFQTIASSYLFWKNGLLDVSRGLIIGIPMIMGTLVGAQILVSVNDQAFNIFLGLILLVILFFIFYKPEAWLKGNEKLQQKRMDWLSFIAYFIIGIYAGFLHVGVGYFLIVALVLLSGYDLMKGNAQKNFLVLLYSPFAIGFFMLSGDLTLKMASYGLIHAIGNVIGASLATHFGIKWGNHFIRWLIFVVVILTALKLFGVIGFPEFG